MALAMQEADIAEQCLCNMGVAQGNVIVQDMKKNFSTINLEMQADAEDDEESARGK